MHSKKTKSLRVLNVESNALSPQDLLHIFNALETNNTLEELRCDGQFGLRGLGWSVFQALNHMLENNSMLQKLGMDLTDPGTRCQINQKLVANTDENGRKKRRNQTEIERIWAFVLSKKAEHAVVDTSG